MTIDELILIKDLDVSFRDLRAVRDADSIASIGTETLRHVKTQAEKLLNVLDSGSLELEEIIKRIDKCLKSRKIFWNLLDEIFGELNEVHEQADKGNASEEDIEKYLIELNKKLTDKL